jgi:hypothetical protein
MRRASTAALAVTLAVAGCGGGGQGDKEKIEATIKDYFAAFADTDPAKACDQLVASDQDALENAAGAKDCRAALTKALQAPAIKRYAPQLRDVKILSVKITGDEATAKVRAIGAATDVPLRKENGDWKIAAKGIAGR